MIQKTEKEVRERVKKIYESNKHVIEQPLISLGGPNDVVCLMQLSAKAQLDELYWVLGEKRPRYACDKEEK